MARNLIDWKTAVLAVAGLLIVVSQLVLLMLEAEFFAHLAGLAIGVGLEIALAKVMNTVAPVGRRGKKRSEAGAEPCPQCGSVQTDLVVDEFPDGRKVSRRQCFNCDHDWQ